MSEDKKYIDILNKARRKRRRNPYRGYLIAGGVAIVLLGVILFFLCMAGSFSTRKTKKTDGIATPATASDQSWDIEIAFEDQKLEQEREKKQAVIDSYENLGLVQVSGYLNIREMPSADGTIIGKLQENSACNILSTEGEWSHIQSGEIEGYVNNQYMITGEDAREQAMEYVKKMAIITADSLNIRKEPTTSDPTNIVGQALESERYVVLSEENGWIKIKEGYISADYATVTYALNEARKLDLRTMALNQYKNLVISKVNNYLNIRKEPSTSDPYNVIGKFPSKAAGEILETLDGWYKIRSGSITGYITADSQYVAVGQEARDLALESATLMAIVNTDRLNVRTQPSTEASIWTQISKEERYVVASQLDGWVQIELDAGDGEGEVDKAYISTRDNNVEVRYALAEAIKFSPLEEKANREASLRNKVVNYALQFVGGRYVWGGTNPNTGADCSGFVQYVLRNAAGVSIPRTSREQANGGRSIKSSEMRPGDLVFYTNTSGVVNHVAMYIGNGQVVHAASTKSGIKISTWNYRTPKYIRSYLD